MEAIVIQYLPSVIMLLIGIWLQRKEKARDDAAKLDREEAEKHRRQMAEWFKKLADCITASNDGMLALAVAYKNDNKNGGLTKAMDTLQGSNDGLNDFIKNIGFDHLAKG